MFKRFKTNNTVSPAKTNAIACGAGELTAEQLIWFLTDEVITQGVVSLDGTRAELFFASGSTLSLVIDTASVVEFDSSLIAARGPITDVSVIDDPDEAGVFLFTVAVLGQAVPTLRLIKA